MIPFGLVTLRGYMLLPTSPCIDAGTPIPDDGGRDFWGHSLEDEQPDIGVYEVPESIRRVPKAPKILQVQQSTPKAVQLEWESNSTEVNGFRIERKSAANSYSPVGVVSARTKTYHDILPDDGTYTYQISAFNEAGVSVPSNNIAVTIQ